uniref:KOW domain-containing protein n=1 Tax=Panagrellus redivivus TaxID=6233 RepID=A0A7E4ZY36_PANRE
MDLLLLALLVLSYIAHGSLAVAVLIMTCTRRWRNNAHTPLNDTKAPSTGRGSIPSDTARGAPQSPLFAPATPNPSETKVDSEKKSKKEMPPTWWDKVPQPFLRGTQVYGREGRFYLVDNELSDATLEKATPAELDKYEYEIKVRIGQKDLEARRDIKKTIGDGPVVRIPREDYKFAGLIPTYQQKLMETESEKLIRYGVKKQTLRPRYGVKYTVDGEGCENTQWTLSEMNKRQNRELAPQRAEFNRRRRARSRETGSAAVAGRLASRSQTGSRDRITSTRSQSLRGKPERTQSDTDATQRVSHRGRL